MDCNGVGKAIYLFFDNELNEDQLRRFQAHVESCPHCAQRTDYTRKVLLVVRRRCIRCQAPVHLRRRILISLQHHRTSSLDA